MDNQIYNNLIELLEHQTLLQPNRLVYEIPGENGELADYITYAELITRSKTLATKIDEHCVPQDRALILCDNEVSFFDAFFACLYTGAIAVPLCSPQNSKDLARIIAVAEDCQPSMILTTQIYQEQVELLLERLGVTLPILYIDVIVDKEPLNTTVQFWGQTFEKKNIAYLQYTLGSLGASKGIMVSHANVMCHIESLYNQLECNEQSYSVSWLPVYSSFGLIFGVLLPIFARFPVTLLKTATVLKHPYLWLKTASDRKATIIGSTNIAFDLCCNDVSGDAKKTLDLSNIKQAIIGIDYVNVDTITRFYENFAECGFQLVALNPCYGIAEATLAVSLHKPDQHVVTKEISKKALISDRVETVMNNGRMMISYGSKLSGLELLIVDPGTRNVCLHSQIGEIWLRGSSVCEGYWNNEVASAHIFGATLASEQAKTDRCYLKTGCLAYLEQGKLFVIGRKNNRIKLRQGSYYLDDINLTLQQCWQGFNNSFGSLFSVMKENEEKIIIIHELNENWSGKLNIEKLASHIQNVMLNIYDLNIDEIAIIEKHRPTINNYDTLHQFYEKAWQANDLKAIFLWQKEHDNSIVASNLLDNTKQLNQDNNSNRIELNNKPRNELSIEKQVSEAGSQNELELQPAELQPTELQPAEYQPLISEVLIPETVMPEIQSSKIQSSKIQSSKIPSSKIEVPKVNEPEMLTSGSSVPELSLPTEQLPSEALLAFIEEMPESDVLIKLKQYH